MPTVHDSGYKRLFSNPTIFRQLMESFVDQPWVEDLDFDSAETLDKSFVSEHYKETESDLIYRLPLGKDQGEVYVYVLLEFQSTVDRWMALRVLNYITNLYMDLVESQGRSQKLPPVFPIVLYNGDPEWTAPTEIADLIQPEPSLGEYDLHFEYFKIAANEFSREQLLAIHNIVSTLFLVETRYDLEEFRREALALFDDLKDRPAISLFVNWFAQLAAHGYIEQEDFDEFEREYRSKEEINAMLITSIAREKQALREEGREEGRREIVLAMSAHGLSTVAIADITGIDEEQIDALIESCNEEQDDE